MLFFHVAPTGGRKQADLVRRRRRRACAVEGRAGSLVATFIASGTAFEVKMKMATGQVEQQQFHSHFKPAKSICCCRTTTTRKKVRRDAHAT